MNKQMNEYKEKEGRERKKEKEIGAQTNQLIKLKWK